MSDVRDFLTSRCSLSAAGRTADSKLLPRAAMGCRLKAAVIKRVSPPHGALRLMPTASMKEKKWSVAEWKCEI